MAKREKGEKCDIVLNSVTFSHFILLVFLSGGDALSEDPSNNSHLERPEAFRDDCL